MENIEYVTVEKNKDKLLCDFVTKLYLDYDITIPSTQAHLAIQELCKETPNVIVTTLSDLQHMAYNIIANAYLDKKFEDNPELVRKTIIKSLNNMD